MSTDTPWKEDGLWESQMLFDAASMNVCSSAGNHSKLEDIARDCERLWWFITRELP